MALQRPTQGQYDALVRVYRTQDLAHGKPVHSQAANIAGVELKVAQRSWSHGWTDAPVLLPIRHLLETTRLGARAKLEKARRRVLQGIESKMDLAQDDAEVQLAIEALGARKAVLLGEGMLSEAYQLLEAAQPLRERLIQKMRELAAAPDANIQQLLGVKRALAEFSKLSMEVFEKASLLESKRLGKPDQVIEVRGAPMPGRDEAIKSVQEFIAIIERWQPKQLGASASKEIVVHPEQDKKKAS